ncbi:MAG: hypothetical protein WAZ34_15465 [Rhodocyclaceae bacterium]
MKMVLERESGPNDRSTLFRALPVFADGELLLFSGHHRGASVPLNAAILLAPSVWQASESSCLTGRCLLTIRQVK